MHHFPLIEVCGTPRQMGLQHGEKAADLIASVKGWKAPEGMNKSELAAWFYIANILLNLDETITKD